MVSNANKNSNNPEFNHKMYQLGVALQEYENFFWTGILLFFLVIPLIILLVKYVKYLIALNNVTTYHPNESLKNASLFLWISFAINIGGSSIAAANFGLAFLNIASIILTYLAYMKLEEWVEIVSRDRNSPSFLSCKEGFSDMKIASVLMVVIVGIFMLPGAMKKTYNAIFAEFGSSPQIAQQSTGSKQFTEPESQSNDPNVQSQIESTRTPNFCRSCGSKITIPNARTCPDCGQPLK